MNSQPLRSSRGTRALTGHRMGEWHQKAKHSDVMVRAARKLRAEGKSYGAVAAALGVSYWTARDWCVGATRICA